MEIITLRSPCHHKKMAESIALAYQQTFAGYPWYESWEINTIISDFEKEMKKPEAICVIAQVDKKIIGFTWGYEVSGNDEIDVHLEAPGLHKMLNGEYFYLDEVAVVPDHQKKGLGGILINQIFEVQKHRHVLLRTKKEGPMFKLVIKRGGEIIQHISRDRVIMNISIEQTSK